MFAHCTFLLVPDFLHQVTGSLPITDLSGGKAASDCRKMGWNFSKSKIIWFKSQNMESRVSLEFLTELFI
jgi:hypothetical protein